MDAPRYAAAHSLNDVSSGNRYILAKPHVRIYCHLRQLDANFHHLSTSQTAPRPKPPG